MFKCFIWGFFGICLSVSGATQTALPEDRLILANQLVTRGLYADAIQEYESLQKEASLARDEVLFRLGEAYRLAQQNESALRTYNALIQNHPNSRYLDFARLNRALLQKGPARATELKALNHVGASEQIRATALYWLGEMSEEANETAAAQKFYSDACDLSHTNRVCALARFRLASLLSISSNESDRQKAYAHYGELAVHPDPTLASEASFYVAMLAYREGRYPTAANLYRTLTKRFPKSERAQECQIFYAWSCFLARHFLDALNLATPLRNEEHNEDAFYLVAASLKALERREEALTAYTLALHEFPGGRHADAEWFERLCVWAASQQHTRVITELETRTHLPDKTAVRALNMGCDAAIALTNYPLAIAYAEQTLPKTDGKNVQQVLHRLAWLYEKTENWSKAALWYRTLAQKEPNAPEAAQALYLAGVSEVRAGRPQQARADWTSLLTHTTNSTWASEALYARAMQELRAKEARVAAHSLAELMQRFPQFSRRAEALYWWGIATKHLNDIPEAEKHFKAALAAKPVAEYEREIRLELAQILASKGSELEALHIYQELLTTQVASRLPLEKLHWMADLSWAQGAFEESMRAAQEIEKRHVGKDWDQIAYALQGRAYEGLHANDTARAYYEKALQTGAHTPTRLEAALALGKLETAQGLFDEAVAHLGEVVTGARTATFMALRVEAYLALAANEEERGDLTTALYYYRLVMTFDDPSRVPRAMKSAISVLTRLNRTSEAQQLEQECLARESQKKVNP